MSSYVTPSRNEAQAISMICCIARVPVKYSAYVMYFGNVLVLSTVEWMEWSHSCAVVVNRYTVKVNLSDYSV